MSSNLVLLCRRCHIENPNVTNPEIMWDWIHAHAAPFYNTFWLILGIKEYEIIYGKSFIAELNKQNIYNNVKFTGLLREELKRTTYYFGYSYPKSATIAGALSGWVVFSLFKKRGTLTRRRWNSETKYIKTIRQCVTSTKKEKIMSK